MIKVADLDPITSDLNNVVVCISNLRNDYPELDKQLWDITSHLHGIKCTLISSLGEEP